MIASLYKISISLHKNCPARKIPGSNQPRLTPLFHIPAIIWHIWQHSLAMVHAQDLEIDESQWGRVRVGVFNLSSG